MSLEAKASDGAEGTLRSSDPVVVFFQLQVLQDLVRCLTGNNNKRFSPARGPSLRAAPGFGPFVGPAPSSSVPCAAFRTSSVLVIPFS